MIRTIVADDEELALDSLIHLLNKEPDIDIVSKCSNGLEAFEAFAQHKPHVIFLDIQMPGLNGLEVAELLNEESTLIVFVTAFDDYAVKAFETHAIDYLLKPVNQERLNQCLKRVKERLKERYRPNLIGPLKKLNTSQVDRILVKEKNQVHIIECNEIFYLEAQDDYVAIFSQKGLFLKKERLGYLETILPDKKFIRIHRSYIANMDYVLKIENSKIAILKDGKKIPVSRTGYKKIIENEV